ncbi:MULTISPECIES: DUF2975 domain-containing protein [unclassified Pannonibacter]|uniref:DUF2975 domain-containing protein n=1 Tax=unclassified Pannonibacter TaxID=2627228 RepID=UPI0016460103|nr:MULTISPECIES: DUF2975 domain-containing protein [unclassified Pannonibacter]
MNYIFLSIALFSHCGVPAWAVLLNPVAPIRTFPMASGIFHSLFRTSDDQAHRLHRIQSFSGGMKWLLTGLASITALFGMLVCVVLLAPGLLGYGPEETVDIGGVSRVILEISLPQRIGITLLLVILIEAVLMLLWKLRQLFARLAELDFFSSRTLSIIVQSGRWLLVLGAMDFVFDPVSSVLMTFDLPEGEKQISLSLEAGQILFLVLGALVLLLGWVMREAALAHEENQQFV